MNNIRKSDKHQRGASAIEFAIVFPLFLIIFYAIVSYALVFVYVQTLSSLSAEAARSAIAIHNPNSSSNTSAIESQILNVVTNSWIPSEDITGCASGTSSYYTLTGGLLEICLQVARPVPILSLLGIDIPDVGETLQSTSKLQLPN